MNMLSTGTGVIENEETYTFKERDSIRMARSINWIKQHPNKYAVSFIKRAYKLYRVGGAAWSDGLGSSRIYYNMWRNQQDTIPSVAEIQSLNDTGQISRMEYLTFMPEKDRLIKITTIKKIFFLVNKKISKTFTYNLILFLFCLALIVHRKEWWSSKGVLLLFLLTFTAGTALYPVEPRYSYPMIFAIVLIAAYGVEYFTDLEITVKRNKMPNDVHS